MHSKTHRGTSSPLLLALFILLCLLAALAAPVVPANAGILQVRQFGSSVDGSTQPYLEYRPTGWNPALEYPLRIELHGRGGDMFDHADTAVTNGADRHGYVVAFPDGRVPWSYYLDSDDYGPGEADFFDMIDHVRANRLIDADRIYISGGSMGGFGSWAVALRNPGYFAAIAPGMAWTDCFQHWDANEYLFTENLAVALGGPPGTSDAVDAGWYQHSARFLIENAVHLPVSVWHGEQDLAIYNHLDYWPYMQAHHVTDTPGFVDSRGAAVTMSELAADSPGNYLSETHWHPTAGHNWRVVCNQEGIYDFFDAQTRDPNPRSVRLQSYDDVHVLYGWLTQVPWEPNTTQVSWTRAEREPETNALAISFHGPHTARVDLAESELLTTEALTITSESHEGYVGDGAIDLDGDWSAPGPITVLRDGIPLVEPVDYTLLPTRLSILAFDTSTPHTFVVSPGTSSVVQDGDAATARPTVRLLTGNPLRGQREATWSIESDQPGSAVLVAVDGSLAGRWDLEAGANTISWDGRRTGGRAAAPGAYILRASTSRAAVSARLVVLP